MIFPPFIDKLNKLFGPENIENVRPEDLPGWDVSLQDALEMLGIPTDGVMGVLDNIPESHLFALRGLLQSAAARNVPLNFAWLPGYDSQMTICEWADRPGEPCGITVLVQTRHASDQRTRERLVAR